MKVISLDKALAFPIRANHYDEKNGNLHFILGVESVIEFLENLPVYDVPEHTLREEAKRMPWEVYEAYCKYCPTLQECMDWGVGCQAAAAAVTLQAGDTYTSSDEAEMDSL